MVVGRKWEGRPVEFDLDRPRRAMPGRDLRWSKHSLFMVSVTHISTEHSEELNSIC
jgi:hypothetical protein